MYYLQFVLDICEKNRDSFFYFILVLVLQSYIPAIFNAHTKSTLQQFVSFPFIWLFYGNLSLSLSLSFSLSLALFL